MLGIQNEACIISGGQQQQYIVVVVGSLCVCVCVSVREKKRERKSWLSGMYVGRSAGSKGTPSSACLCIIIIKGWQTIDWQGLLAVCAKGIREERVLEKH